MQNHFTGLVFSYLKEILYKSSVLYNFCRTLDDLADNKNSLKLKKENFQNLKRIL